MDIEAPLGSPEKELRSFGRMMEYVQVASQVEKFQFDAAGLKPLI